MAGTDADAASEERFNDRVPLERARDRAQALVREVGMHDQCREIA
jgi:hypothetical protein